MKYYIMIGIVFLVCLFSFLPTIHADNGQMYKVDTETIELMDAPAEDATILGELKKDYKVTIFEDSYYGWGKTFYNGKQAWVALHRLAAVDDTQTEPKNEKSNTEEQHAETSAASDPASDEPGASGQMYHVKAPAVNVRNAPDENATIITQLNNGNKVTIFQESYGWGKTYYNGEEAWIALYLLGEDDATDNIEKTDTLETTEERQIEASEAAPDQKDDEIKNENNESQENKQEAHVEQSFENPLNGRHFVIDPGHGGKDPGAIGSEINEKTLTLSTAKKLEKQLRNKGASVTLTRTDDTYISLEKRVKISNSANTDAFISLHYNSSKEQGGHGVETFYYAGEENQKLANAVQTSVINHVNLHNRGAKQADFQVLKDNNQLSILLELGFINNSEEQKLVQTDRYQEDAAKGIVTALEAYFNE